MIGKTLSHFRILAKLGEGGMGVVYRAEGERLRRQVALKVLPPDLVSNEERRLRFLREARVAAAVTHPNIATVYDVGEAEGVVFIAMELVEGKTLRSLIGGRPIAVKEAVRLASEMAEGLARAHQAHIVHRDFKPDNVIVGQDGHPKILDFGLAKLVEVPAPSDPADLSRLETISREMTREGRIFGTAAYMSPEQARGRSVDVRSDQFSFGITLYEMVTGQPPFRGQTGADLLSAIIRDEPPPLSQANADVPPELERIVSKCLEKDPEERYQDTRDLAVDFRKLKRVTDSGVQTVKTPGAPASVTPTPSGLVAAAADRQAPGRQGLLGRRTWIGASAGILLALAGLGIWWKLRPPAGFKPGDKIIVADFENATGRPEFDTAVHDAFEERMGRSTVVQLVRGDPLKELMVSRTGGEVLHIGPDVAERLCGDGACAGYATGKISIEGTGFRLEASLVRIGEAHSTIVRSALVADDQSILKAIHDVSLEIRRALGETPQAVSNTSPPSTRSLAAYQLVAIWARRGEAPGAEDIPLLRKALEIDPSFVGALSLLGTAYWNMGEFRAWRKAVTEAYAKSSSLNEKDRLWAEIDYLDANYEFETETDRLKTFSQLYPFDSSGPEALAFLLEIVFQDPVQAEMYYRAAYRADPRSPFLLNLCSILSNLGKDREIEELARDFQRRGGSEQEAAETLLFVYYARGDWQSLQTMARREMEEQKGRGESSASLAMWALIAAGRLNDAHEVAEIAWRYALTSHNAAALQVMGLARAWLAFRSNRPVSLAPESLKAARNHLHHFRAVATFCVETGRIEPLAELLREHEAFEKGNRNRFVQEELVYGRACLAYVRRDHSRARAALEPLAAASQLVHVHHVLARTYEALGLWREAAGTYEEVLRYRYRRDYHLNGAVWVLDEFRLAGAYEKLGDTASARQWYEKFLSDWKDADPDIPEVIEARKRLQTLATVAAPPAAQEQ